jgi:hypothetical protein
MRCRQGFPGISSSGFMGWHGSGLAPPVNESGGKRRAAAVRASIGCTTL